MDAVRAAAVGAARSRQQAAHSRQYLAAAIRTEVLESCPETVPHVLRLHHLVPLNTVPCIGACTGRGIDATGFSRWRRRVRARLASVPFPSVSAAQTAPPLRRRPFASSIQEVCCDVDEDLCGGESMQELVQARLLGWLTSRSGMADQSHNNRVQCTPARHAPSVLGRLHELLG